jgi:hypothetical protein
MAFWFYGCGINVLISIVGCASEHTRRSLLRLKSFSAKIAKWMAIKKTIASFGNGLQLTYRTKVIF